MLCKNRIGKYLKVQGGFAFKSSSYQESGIPIIRISNITDRGIILDNICVSTDIMEQTSGYLAEINDSLIAMSGATTGKMGLVSAKNLPALINQRVGRFVYIKNSDKRYFYQLSLSNEFQRQVEINAMGGAQPNISPQKIENIELYIEINTDEQSKIADILSTCDEVIEKTEETIEKYKQIKAGMMQDLFTRGLDENGKLRPTYAQAPDLYKYSKELDRYIPKEWDTKLLEEYTTLIKDGTHGTHKDIPNGIPLLSAKDIQDGEIIISNDCRTISQLDYNSIHKSYSINVNDVLLTIVGTIGRVAIVKNIEKLFTFQRSVAIIKLINPKFANYFYYYLLYENTQKQLLKMMNASAQGGLYLGQLANVIITMPKDEYEIKDIFNYLNQMDSKIKIEEQYLNKYKQIKQGLMKRLLTPPADAEIVEE